MKRVLFLLLASATIASGGEPPAGDGSSLEKAIKLNCAHDAAVSEESKWISEHYPGATILQPYQRHSFEREIPGKGMVFTCIDELRIVTTDGSRKSILFDVSYLK
jgi:hypothetical protein